MWIPIILSLALCLSQTSAQLPGWLQSGSPPQAPRPSAWSSGAPSGGWQSSGAPAPSWQSSGAPSGSWQSSPSLGFQSAPNFAQYQPYRAPTPSAPTASIPSPTLSSLSGYNRFPSLSQPQPQWAPSANRFPSLTQSSPAFAGIPRSPGSQLTGYARPAPVAQSQPSFQGTPSQFSWNINHQGSGAGAQPSVPLAAPQPQVYRPPAGPSTQSWPAAAPQQSWSPPSSAPTQSWPTDGSWRPPTQAVSAQSWPTDGSWRPPTSVAPAQSWSQPSTSSWSPPQTYSAPAPAPVAAPQPAPQSVSSYSSPQNSQNVKPAPVHYASIGQQLQGDYKFGYHTGDGGSFREETRLPDGTVQGAYGFVDADGKQRIVKYTAGKNGFQAEGDDVPKGTPVAGGSAPQAEAPQSVPADIGEGAAFRSFSQG